MGKQSVLMVQDRALAVFWRRTMSALAFLVPLLIHLAGSTWIALAVPFPSVIDELEHLSFIRAMAVAPSLFPDHSRLLVLKRDLSGFGAEQNYLNHPPPYYLAMAALDRPELGPETSVKHMRLIDVALSTVAIAIILLAGAVALPDAASGLVFGLVLILFPKLPVVSGLINNDDFGLMATAITFAGLLWLLRTENMAAAVLVGLGVALAGWTKLTAAVMLGSAAFICIFMGVRHGRLRSPRLIAAACVVAAAGTIPTLYNLATLGRPLYVNLAVNAIPVDQRPALSFLDYFGLFFQQFAFKWPAFEPGTLLQALTPLVVLVLAGLGIRRSWHSEPVPPPKTPARIVATGFVFALLPSLLIHVVYGYQAFLANGDLTVAQTRYYYALWPGFALALALLFTTLTPRPVRTWAAGIVLLFLSASTVFVFGVVILARGGA